MSKPLTLTTHDAPEAGGAHRRTGARSKAARATRDPEGTRARIMRAARDEFAAHGLAGARIDRIADMAGTNKRMLYYHVGNKEDLFLAVLEEAYADIRAAERELNLEALEPPDAIARLIAFTWQYFIERPQFLALLNNENLYHARHLGRSTKVHAMHSPFVQMIADVLARGVGQGVFRPGVDPVQLYISIAGLAYFYLSNVHTLSTVFRRDLLAEGAKDERLRHMIELILKSLRP